MAASTAIDWTDATLNPVTWRCTPVGIECLNCYAQTQTNRYQGPGAFTSGPPELKPWRLLLPWKDPEMREAVRIFLMSMSDPFHSGLSFADMALIWAMMAADRRHTYQVLTKRAGAMHSRMNSKRFALEVHASLARLEGMARDVRRLTPWRQQLLQDIEVAKASFSWPLPNVWLGVSCGTQHAADQRIPRLIGSPARVRFLSCEPLLERVVLARWTPDDLAQREIHWVIAGGESGGRHRPVKLDDLRSLRDECHQGDVPFWLKQIGGVTHAAGGDTLDGQTWKRFPVAA